MIRNHESHAYNAINSLGEEREPFGTIMVKEYVLENRKLKILWNFDYPFLSRRLDLVIINKKRKLCLIMDFDLPADNRVSLKESEKFTSTLSAR